MNMTVSFRGMGHSDALENYARTLISEVVETFLHKPQSVDLTFNYEHQKVSLHCKVIGDRHSIQVNHEGEPTPHIVDEVAEKLRVQLRRQKEKMTDHHRHAGAENFDEAQIERELAENQND